MNLRNKLSRFTPSLLWIFLACPVWAQVSPAPPEVREVFAQKRPDGGDLLPTARLRSYLGLVVCKADYDAWAQGQHPMPDLSLYLDGAKATPAAPPRRFDKDPRSEKQTQATREQCAGNAPAAADSLDAAAKAAATAARAEADEAGATYVLGYYLDPEFLTGSDTKDAWLQLLQRPWESGDIAVSAGPAAGAWPSVARIPFQRLNQKGFAVWAAAFLAAIVMFVRYARNSDIIRDTGTLPAGTAPGTRKSYSLARTQMALWTFIVAAALVFIFLVTWNENTITSGVLILIGISSGTTLLAASTDGTQPVPQPTQGLFADLLNDGTGPSFHRYQMLLFTLILAVIFVVKVANNLVMPQFDPMLLGLMGISNGTYLGFKLQGQ